MDRCEALAAAYGVPPRQVLHWPMVQVEEWWVSYLKRDRREMKKRAMTSGLGALGGVTSVDADTIPAVPKKEGPQLDRVPSFVYDGEWQGQHKQVQHQRAWYGDPEIHAAKRRPTDADDWDVPPTEVFKLAQKFPGAVQIVKKT